MRGDRVDSTKNNMREHYRPTIPQSHQHQEYVTGLCMAGVLAPHAARPLVFVGASPSSNAFPYGRNGPFLTKQFLAQNDMISCSSDNYEPFPGKQQIPKCDFFFSFLFYSKSYLNSLGPSCDCRPRVTKLLSLKTVL